jgi:phenylacetate-coenzyme A ligase PaaK-like adenylate-forming protein
MSKRAVKNDSMLRGRGIRFPSDYGTNCLKSLQTALRRVRAYEDWRGHDPGTHVSVDERYAGMPVLTKAHIRQHTFDGLVPRPRDHRDGIERGAIELVRTSGTTDDQVTLIWNQRWWNASERASWKLNVHARCATGRHREAILSSPICVGFLSESGSPIPTEGRRLRRFLYLNEIASPADWTVAHLDRMVRELAEFRPVVLEANPSLLSKLARHINRTGARVFSPRLIVLTYEYPSRVHLRQIRRAFNAPVASSYGSTESGYVFMECESGSFHQNAGFCRVDLQPLKRRFGGGENVGRLLVTTFHNPWFSVVRFNVGDVVRFMAPGSCPCGRREGYVGVMEGRAKDITFATDGRAVTVNRLDAAVARLDWVVEYQVEQSSHRDYMLRAVAEGPCHNGRRAEAKRILSGLYGTGARVSIRLEDVVLPEVSGKHRLAKTSFPVDVDALFEGGKA